MALGQTIPSTKAGAARAIGLSEHFMTMRIAYPAEWTSADIILQRELLDEALTKIHVQTPILLKEDGFELKFINPQHKMQFLDWMLDNKHPMANDFHGKTVSLDAFSAFAAALASAFTASSAAFTSASA